jgi:hypothetical protein
VISTEGESGSADLSVDAGTGTGSGTVQGCAPDPDRDNTQQSSEDMTVDETGDETSGGQGGVPAACSTPLRGAESYRIVTTEMPVDRRTESSFPGFVAAAADIGNTQVVRGNAHSAGESDGGQGDANSASKSGDGNSAESRIIISEKLAKAISAARKSDAARKGDAAGICDAAAQSDASKSRVPAMVPPPAAPPVNPPAKKKQEKEPDAVPSATYKSILAAKVNKITPPTIPGTGKATANLDCGSFYNTGDNRIRRAVYKENVATRTVSSISFNPVTCECSSCPVKHPILGGGSQRRGGGGTASYYPD